MEGKWLRLENAEATATLKQHLYVPTDRKTRFIGSVYSGNKAACDRMAGVMNEEEEFVNYNDLDGEPLDEINVCKRCLKKFNNHGSKNQN
jgi:hypothetical protein